MARATWIGPWGHKLPDGTELIPGETECDVPESQATDDPNWDYTPPKQITQKPEGGDK
jgi:hypothetical protein